MKGSILKVLERTNYMKLKYEEDDAFWVFPLLYFTEEKLVMYNKNNVEIQNGGKVIAIASEEDYEYVISGAIKADGNNININVVCVEKFPNKRKHKRYNVNIDAVAEVASDRINVKVINLSEFGALITVPQDLNINDELTMIIGEQRISGVVLRKDERNSKISYGLKFRQACDIISILKKMRADLLQNHNMYVLLDDFNDIAHYGNLFEKEVNIIFINIKANCESFIIDYMEKEKDDIIMLDMKDEDSIIELIEKLYKYIEVEKYLIVLLNEDFSDELVNYLDSAKISYIFKPIIETEIKKYLIGLS